MTYYNLGAGGPYYFTTKISVVKPPTIVFFFKLPKDIFIFSAISLPSPKVLPSVFVLLKSDVDKIQPKTKIEPHPPSASGPHHSLMENLWCKIFSFLSTRDRASIAATCKPFQRFGTEFNHNL